MDNETITVYARIFGLFGPILYNRGLKFKVLFWIQDFEADFLWKVSLKMLNLPVNISFSDLFSGYLKTI